jgi:hypothetical protein
MNTKQEQEMQKFVEERKQWKAQLEAETQQRKSEPGK